ncbi:MAG: hypothetical protein LBM38_06370 [Clostridiales bacterium]|jgi:hypothetical protein|nr:hypothetical protein [Clostridiales bacterium]
MKYTSLDELISTNSRAKDYWDRLPDYVRSQIQTRGDNVNSFASLCDYAENLLRGDC